MTDTTHVHDSETDSGSGPALAPSEQVVRVPVDTLLTADSPRSSGEDPEHVRTLTDVGGELPPITVHRRTMRVIDGMHRLRVAREHGRETIPVRFFDGDEADAFVLAVQANIAHGLPLSSADRKLAATRIIRTHPRWSDRRIAAVTGLAAKTVSEVRRVHGEPVGARVGQDGRVRPINSAEGRRRAVELLRDNPDLSLRQVARTVGISPETVRDVRARLNRGDDVLPGPRTTTPTGRAAEHTRPGDWVPAVRQLVNDPALRFNESGRALLHILGMHATSDESWAQLLDSVPVHCRAAVADAAQGCAARWQYAAWRLGQDGRHTA